MGRPRKKSPPMIYHGLLPFYLRFKVRRQTGVAAYPAMPLHERAINVLSCRAVSDVIIGAPGAITGEMITTFNISSVVRFSETEDTRLKGYEVAAEKGILDTIVTAASLSMDDIVDRIVGNRRALQERTRVRTAKIEEYLEAKSFVSEGETTEKCS